MALNICNPEAERLAAELEAIAEHCARLPALDARSADEILGYDERAQALLFKGGDFSHTDIPGVDQGS